MGIDQEYLREHQYKDPTNLNARIALHAKYSRTDEPWYPWLAGRIEWPEGGEVLEVAAGPVRFGSILRRCSPTSGSH